ncbi:LuxR family transcriptional regulator [Kitasatospora sp. NBC_01560]|uniref:helix-turn-helix transcriptional regulator n=1 Tax=Kitasatospora sp. NBC_01560 TaxID=2975965 RepID=UPI00386FEE68
MHARDFVHSHRTVAAVASPADPAADHHEEERRALSRLLVEVEAGGPAVALVAGPPGFGQNALVRRAARRAEQRGLRVLWACAARFERESHHGVVGQLFTAAAVAGEPAPGRPPRPSAVLSAARERPTLVAVENAQWLDAESLGWLCALLRRSAGHPVAVLAGGSTVTVTGPDWRDLAAAPPGPVTVRELTLSQLDAAEAAAVVAQACGRTGEERFTAAAHAIAAGHPAVLREALRQFAAHGHRPVADRIPELRTIGSRVLGDQVTRVLGGLEDEVVGVLRALAVCGDLLDLPAVCHLARVTAVGEVRLRGALAGTGLVRSAAARPRLDPVARVRVLEETTPDERARLHAEAAELAHRGAVDDRTVAALLLGARPVGAPWAGAALRRGGLAALRQGERERAVGYLVRALAEETEPEPRARLGLELAAVELLSAPDAGDRRLDGIVRGGTAPAALRVRSVDLALGCGDAEAMRRAVADVLPATHGSERDDLIALFWSADPTGPDGAVSFSPEVPALPDRPASPTQAGVRAWQLARAGDRRELARQLARIALSRSAPARAGAAGELIQPRLAACKALLLTDDHDEAEAGFSSLLAELRSRQVRLGLAPVFAARAELQLRRGRLAAAEADISAAEQALVPVGRSADTMPYLRAVRIVVELGCGRVDRARSLASTQLPGAARAGAYWPHLLFARALVASAETDPRQALELLREAGRRLLNRHHLNPALLPWRSLAARACRELGDHPEALRLSSAELQLARRWGAPIATAWAELCAHRTDGTDRAATVRGIVRTAGSGPAGPGGPVHARALAELVAAELARGSGGRSAAAAALAELTRLDTTHPDGPMAARARRLARELARTSERDGDGHPAWSTLSPAEQQTVLLVGRGHSNRSAADVLMVSTRTVELRLSRAYRKLHISGRQELCALLRETEGR